MVAAISLWHLNLSSFPLSCWFVAGILNSLLFANPLTRELGRRGVYHHVGKALKKNTLVILLKAALILWFGTTLLVFGDLLSGVFYLVGILLAMPLMRRFSLSSPANLRNYYDRNSAHMDQFAFIRYLMETYPDPERIFVILDKVFGVGNGRQDVEDIRELAGHWDSAAQFSIGLRPYFGKFADKSMDEAYYWFLRSSMQGYAPARFMVERIQRIGEKESAAALDFVQRRIRAEQSGMVPL